MKEKPINFSSEMVRAILLGRKTQNREIIKPQPRPDPKRAIIWNWESGTWCWESNSGKIGIFTPDKFNSKYVIGDHLWVREPWAPMCDFVEDAYCSCLDEEHANEHHYIEYQADTGNSYPGQWTEEFAKGNHDAPKWRSSTTMTRKESRITLEVKGVRVERIQDIGGDSLAEGVGETKFWTPSEVEDKPFEDKWWDDYEFWNRYPPIAFSRFWDSVHGAGAWDRNDWVFVYDFKMV